MDGVFSTVCGELVAMNKPRLTDWTNEHFSNAFKANPSKFNILPIVLICNMLSQFSNSYRLKWTQVTNVNCVIYTNINFNIY